MNCEETRELLTQYCLKDLNEARAAEVRTHLQECDGCRAAVREIEPTLDLLRDALAATSKAPERLPQSHRKRVIYGESSRTRRVIQWVTVSHPGLAIAAGTLVMTGFFLLLLSVPMLSRSRVHLGRADRTLQVEMTEPEEMEEMLTEAFEDSAEIPLARTEVRGRARAQARTQEPASGEDDDSVKLGFAVKRAPRRVTRLGFAGKKTPDGAEVTTKAHWGRENALVESESMARSPVRKPTEQREAAEVDALAAAESSLEVNGRYAGRTLGERIETLQAHGGAVVKDADGEGARRAHRGEIRADVKKQDAKGWVLHALDGSITAGKPTDHEPKPAPAPGSVAVAGRAAEHRRLPADDLAGIRERRGYNYFGLGSVDEKRKEEKAAEDLSTGVPVEESGIVRRGGVAGEPAAPARDAAPADKVELFFGGEGGVVSDERRLKSKGRTPVLGDVAMLGVPFKAAGERARKEILEREEAQLPSAAEPMKSAVRRDVSSVGEMSRGGDFIEMAAREGPPEKDGTTLRKLLGALRTSRKKVLSQEERRQQEVARDRRQKTLAKLDKIVIPEVDFRQANVRDVLEYIHEASVEFDTTEDRESARGVSIVAMLGGEGDAGGTAPDLALADPFAVTQGGAAAGEGEQDGLITFSARYISAREALEIATKVSNLKYRVENGAVVVSPIGAPEGDIIHRMYDVPPSAANELTALGIDSSIDATSALKGLLSAAGVASPAGSSIKYVPAIRKLVVANTADNLATFEGLLASAPDEGAEEEEKAREEDLTGPRFKAVGVNPFHTAAERPFSTFSIDVDTAAYTVTRNYMSQGFLPPAESVRTEEFVNFFDYAYKPAKHATFRVYAECAPSRFGRGLHLLKIGIKGRRLGREEQRRAVLTLLIDTSGSMGKPDRLALIKKSLRMLVDKLAPRDLVAIVQYSSHARLVLEHTPVARKERILGVIDGMQCSGSTNLEEGMTRAYSVASRSFVGGAENRVLLLSDGAANLGTLAAADILKKIEKCRKQGIYCSVFGFGIGTYDDTMLETLANKGNGNYAFIDSDDEAKRVFVDDLGATLNTIAADVKIQVEFNPERVRRYRQLGYENRQLKKEDFRNDAVDAGEVGSGQSVTALYELELKGTGSWRSTVNSQRPVVGKRDELAVVRVRYRRVDTGKVEEIQQRITDSDILEHFKAAPARFRLAACVAEFAEILRVSPFAAGSDCEDVAADLRPVALELELDGRVQELLRMVHGARGMSRGE